MIKPLRPTLRSILREDNGSSLVEFGLVILPLMGVLFLIIDVAWLIFAQGSLQWAVQQGVRYAITSNTMAGKGQDASIKTVVQNNAMGFLAGDTGLSKINISFYSPSNLSNGLTGSGSNLGGNVVKVSVTGVQWNALGPVFRGGLTTVYLSASSSDVLEGSPVSGPPTR